jgi:hypothetical protein
LYWRLFSQIRDHSQYAGMIHFVHACREYYYPRRAKQGKTESSDYLSVHAGEILGYTAGKQKLISHSRKTGKSLSSAALGVPVVSTQV